jgi:anti-sigma factor RsiW
VAPMERMKEHCTGMESKLADLLLDPVSASAKVREHVAQCDGCQEEIAELRATMDLLDAWQAPEPNPYFLTRMKARMREEREAEPSGWLQSRLARLRASLVYGPRHYVRPVAAMALTVLLLVGGGTYLDLSNWNPPAQTAGQAAVVHDLQTLDNNAQVLDQLEALSNQDNGD